MTLITKFLISLPYIFILWLGQPWVFSERMSRFYDEKKQNSKGRSKLEHYVERWALGFICLITTPVFIFFFMKKPSVFIGMIFIIFLVDGLMILCRFLFVHNEIKHSTGTDIVPADIWKDKE